MRTERAAPLRVLIVQTAYIGDVVFASRLAQALHQRYPEARLALLVRPETAAVAQLVPGVAEVFTLDKRGAERGPRATLRAAARLRRERFDWWLCPHRSVRSALLALLAGAPFRAGFASGLGRLCYHRAAAFQADRGDRDRLLLRAAGIEIEVPPVRLRLPEGQAGYTESFLKAHPELLERRPVALCLGSARATKRWPPAHFAALAAALRTIGFAPVLFGSAAERALEKEVQAGLGRPAPSSLGNTLEEATALLARMAAVVGGDTGLAHIARALEVPTVLLYGPTAPRLDVQGSAIRVLSASLACRPCSRRGPRTCPKKHGDCMRLILPGEVLEAVLSLAK